VLEQILKAPQEDDYYFGTNLNVREDVLLVVGTNTIYYFKSTNSIWSLENTYRVPESTINYDYKVHIIERNFIVGSYGFNHLEGALFTKLMYDKTSDDSVINQENNMSTNIYKKRIYNMLFLLTISNFCVLLIIVLAFLYWKLFSIPYDEKKKKKSEEEEMSPYKVYSYLGYSENDEIPFIQYNPSTSPPYNYYNPFINYNNIPSNINSLNVNPLNVNFNNVSYDNTMKEDKEDIKYKEDKINNNEIDSKETIVSYKGYLYDTIKQRYQNNIKPILDEIKSKNNIQDKL
jgi:hypothetical protein